VGLPRIRSVDALRGLVMWLIASEGFGLGALADEGQWASVGRWFRHAPWDGITVWDTIQPTFTFVAGVGLALAAHRRRDAGSTTAQLWRWVIGRAVRLIIASQIIIALARGEVLFQLIDSLSQIALSMLFVFAIVQLRVRWQMVAGVGLLLVHSLAHVVWAPIGGAWAANDTVGLRLDRFLFGWPYYDGAYSTFNVVSSALYTLVGWWVAQLLLQRPPIRRATMWLGGGAAAAWVAAALIAIEVPLIKSLSTPSFVLAALGCVLALMLVAYAVCDLRESPYLGGFFVVMGRSAILVYAFDNTARWWFEGSVNVFSGGFERLGSFGPVAVQLSVGLVMWSACWWFHRRGVAVTL
jgi:heparan-alpha-glucosaminide N-acetyltransferase